MLKKLRPTLYARVAADRLTVTNIGTGAAYWEVPEITVTRAGAMQIVDPFSHPRSLMSVKFAA